MMISKGNKLYALSSSPSPWTPADPIVDPERKSKLLRLMVGEIMFLQSSGFYERFLLRLQSPQVQACLAAALASSASSASTFNIVVYGVGSIESSRNSRLQLALALLLREDLGPWAPRRIELFDPVLSATECAVATELGFDVAAVNEYGRREVTVPTLFYMPHCDARLYDALLETNWQPSELNQMVILGNSFADYESDVALGCRGLRVMAMHMLLTREKNIVTEIHMTVEPRTISDGHAIRLAFSATNWHFFHSF